MFDLFLCPVIGIECDQFNRVSVSGKGLLQFFIEYNTPRFLYRDL